jgi:phage-related protein (TIGR01555 family)
VPRKKAPAADPVTPVLREDGWENALSGIGTDRDKRKSHAFWKSALISQEVCGYLYAQDDLARAVCESVTKDAMRGGYKLTRGEDESETLEKLWKRLKIDTLVKQARIWGRVYGRGAIVLGLPGTNLEQPAKDGQTLAFATVVTGPELLVASIQNDPMKPGFGEPETYWLNRKRGSTSPGTKIHKSRLIVFGGVLTPPEIWTEQQCDMSVLQAVYPTLQDLNSVWDSILAMLNDLSQVTIKMKGLIQAISAGKAQTIKDRLTLMDQMRSAVRMIPLDADGEDLDVVERTALGGVTALIDQAFARFSVAAEMPVSRLFGTSAAGLNATGEGDRVNWYDVVRSEQDDQLGPAILELANRLEPGDWEIEWCPLDEPTAKEALEMGKIQADTDAIYLTNQVLDPTELLALRFEKGVKFGYEGIEIMTERPTDVEPDPETGPEGPAEIPGQASDPETSPAVPGRAQVPSVDR